MKFLRNAPFILLALMMIAGNVFSASPKSENHRNPLVEQFENSQRYNALLKKVHQSIIINDMENLTNWSVRGIGKISITEERSVDGNKSLRFQTSLRDEELITKNAAEHGTYDGATGGSTSAILSFQKPQDWSKYNRIALWVYVHPTEMRSYSLTLRLRCIDADTSITSPNPTDVIQHLLPGQWNYVLWEIPNLRRDKVTEFSIVQSLRGYDPEVEGIVTYDIDHIELQKVDEDKYEGWDVAAGKIAFNHVGYQPEQSKIAIASGLSAADFQLIDWESGKNVLMKPVKTMNNNRGQFQVLDFSEVQRPGKYFLQAGEIKTRSFGISDTVWKRSIAKAINYYYGERCGYDIPGEHRECHRDWQGIHNGEKKIISGGWHDAGDLSQGSFRTGMAVYAMFEIINQLSLRGSDSKLKKQVLEEALWGLDWLLKTRFGNGYRITWSTMRIYTDCKVGTIDDVVTPAQNTPWENFLGAAVEALAYNVLKDKNPDIALKSLKSAEEDWEAAVRLQSQWLNRKESFAGWAMDGTYLPLSWGIVSSINLFKATGNKKYADCSIEYGRQLMKCQEREFLDGIPITGFFYTSQEKKSILHHLHPAFEESPLLALTELCKTFAGHEDWMEWYGAVTLHSEYFFKRGSGYSAPYNLVPNSVYRKSEIMSIPDQSIRDIALRQFSEGTFLSDGYSLRIFPIWLNRTFHGNTAVHLSETLALTLGMLLRNDPAGEDVAYKQLQWVFGGNPFSQTLMYGEGYDYVPQFAPSSGDIVGSLPVGVDCMKDDKPYWTNSNYATYKEVWVVPVSRFLWNVAYLGMPALVQGKIEGTGTVSFINRRTGAEIATSVGSDGKFQMNLSPGEYTIKYGTASHKLTIISGNTYNLTLNSEKTIDFSAALKNLNAQRNVVQIEITAEGKGAHGLELRAFNGTVVDYKKIVNLSEGNKATINWEIQIKDPNAPWVAVIIPDGEISLKKELTGTMEEK